MQRALPLSKKLEADMAVNPEFEIGMELFTKDGRRVELLAITTDGAYVVNQVLRFEDYDGSYGYGRGETTFEEELWKKAPVAVIDAEIAVAETKLRDAERLCSEKLSQALNAEREIKDRLAKLAKYKGLEHLEDFIDGRFTHMVLHSYGDYEIKTKDAALDQGDRYDKRLRLLSLYGDTNGDLAWGLNRYRDGSGNSEHVIPCLSVEEAREKVRELCEADIDGWRSGAKNAYALSRAVSSLKKAGLPVDDDVIAADIHSQSQALAKEVEEKEKALNVVKARLAALHPSTPEGDAS
jgi:hypothetical protein